MTTLNTPALRVQTLMGRDLAAFADPDEAFAWVEAGRPVGRTLCRYIRPDGASMAHKATFRPLPVEALGAMDHARTTLRVWAMDGPWAANG